MIEKFRDFITALNPFFTPPAIAAKGDLPIIQERILHLISLGISLISIVALILFLPAVISSGRIVPGLVYFLLGIFLISLAFWRSAPYFFRAGIFLVTVYLTAFYALYNFGISPIAASILLCFVIFSIVFFNRKAGIGAGLMTVFTLAFFAYAFNTQLFPAPVITGDQNPTTIINWVHFAIPLVVVIGLAAIVITALIRGFTDNLQNARRLSANLEGEQERIDHLLQERTSRLERRELQLRTASQISREISTMMDPGALLGKVVRSVRENFGLYYAGIFLLDEEGRYAILRAGTGEAGEKMIAAGHSLEIGGTSMIGWCISNRKARIALDVGTEQVRFNNPYLPLTRSEMALPIVYQNRALGALTIQSVEPGAFVDEDIIILQGIADSLAIALENARLFQNTQQALDELRLYNKAFIQDTWGKALSVQSDLAFSFQNQGVDPTSSGIRHMNIPVTLREEQIGEINLETAGEVLSQDDRDFLDAILTQTALALENARLLEETQRRAVQEQKLNELTTQLSKASSIEYILQTAARELGQLPLVSEVSVQLVSANNEYPNPGSAMNGKGEEN
ncbi:MAG TPA: GAF domain-containing protein [Longilinea sp.]|nr:GAF domain-containing protein [Longilinea sp.]